LKQGKALDAVEKVFVSTGNQGLERASVLLKDEGRVRKFLLMYKRMKKQVAHHEPFTVTPDGGVPVEVIMSREVHYSLYEFAKDQFISLSNEGKVDIDPELLDNLDACLKGLK